MSRFKICVRERVCCVLVAFRMTSEGLLEAV